MANRACSLYIALQISLYYRDYVDACMHAV